MLIDASAGDDYSTAAVPVSPMERRKMRAQPSAVATAQQAEMTAAAPLAVTAVPAPSAVF